MLKKRMLGAVLVVGLGVSLAPLHAQRGLGPMGQPGPNMGRSLDLALEHQGQLGLTGDQVSRLSELKAAMDRDVLPLADEMKALRESIRAGEVDRAEGFRQREALRGELITATAPLRGRVQEILTVEQHKKLQAIVWQGRPGLGRGGPGFRQGFRGPGRFFRGRWGGGATIGS